MPYFLVTELSNDLPSGGIKIGFLGSSCRGAAHGKVCLNTQQPQAQSPKPKAPDRNHSHSVCSRFSANCRRSMSWGKMGTLLSGGLGGTQLGISVAWPVNRRRKRKDNKRVEMI